MAFDFPSNPTVGQVYGNYTWDGEKWGITPETGGGGGGGVPSSTNPIMDGVASPGASIEYSRGDHVHPTDTSRASVAYVDSQDALKASVSHTHTASQVTDFSEVVDDRVASLLVAGTNVTVTYNDVANTLTIASSGGSGGGIAEAPSDGNTYGRLNAAWTQVLPITGGTLTGALTISGAANLNITSAAKGVTLRNNAGAQYLALSSGAAGHYTIITNPDGSGTFQSGDSTDPTNYYNHTNHLFTNLANNVTYLSLAAAGALFSVQPSGPTPTIGDSSTKLATTAFVNNSVMIASGTDLNTVLNPGSYAVASSPVTNGPTPGGQFYLHVIAYPSAPTQYLVQTAYDLLGSGDVWTRASLGGTWQPWVKLATKAYVDTAIAGIPAATVPRGYIDGLTLLVPGGTNSFGINVGAAVNSTNAAMMTITGTHIKTTAAWSLGSGGGGLDTGAIAANSWYHAFVIRRPDTGVVDGCISAGVIPTFGVNIPAAYTQYRRVGSILTDGSSLWIGLIQFGDECLWTVSPFKDVDTAALGTTHVLTAMTLPRGVQVNGLFRGMINSATAGAEVLLSSPDEVAVAVDNVNGNRSAVVTANGVANALGTLNVRTNTSGQIRYVANAASTTLRIVTYGWIDRRGRDAL